MTTSSVCSTAITVAAALAAIYLLGSHPRAGHGLVRGKGREATVVVRGAEGSYRCTGSTRRLVRGAGEAAMGECKAIREGYRPALGIGCGSRCPEAPLGAAVSARP
jgi:hypothetical protein